MNAEENQNNSTSSKNTELIHREKIPNSPFEIMGNDEKGYCIIMGKYRLTEPTNTIAEQHFKLQEEQWNIITNLVVLIQQTALEHEEAFKTIGKEETINDKYKN